MTTTHKRHTANTTRDRAYDGTARNQRHAGNITRVETCKCGAERRTHINGGGSESTGWYMPEGDDAEVAS